MHTTRRTLLASTAVGISTAVAGCLSDSAGGGSGDHSTGDEPATVRNGGILELSFEDGVTPARIRVEAAAEISLTITNNGDVTHELVGDDVGLDPLQVPTGVTKSTQWRTPERPGTGTFRCSLHERNLVDVRIVPADVSSGCPTG